MNRESAVLNAAFVLGKCRTHLADKGYAGLAGECDRSIKDLQAGVAECEPLPVNELIEALTSLARRYTASI